MLKKIHPQLAAIFERKKKDIQLVNKGFTRFS